MTSILFQKDNSGCYVDKLQAVAVEVGGMGCKNRANCLEAIWTGQASDSGEEHVGKQRCEMGNQEFCVGHDKQICLLDISMRKSQLKGKVQEREINLNIIISTKMFIEVSLYKEEKVKNRALNNFNI